MLAQGDTILDYIPQRPPVVMIDSLHSCDTQKTITGLKVASSNIFFENGTLSESGLVENIAQTAAAGVGFVCKQEGREVPVGFIAAVKDLKIYALPVEGDILRTEVNVQNQVLDVTIIGGKVSCNERVLAECEMRIFLKNNS